MVKTTALNLHNFLYRNFANTYKDNMDSPGFYNLMQFYHKGTFKDNPDEPVSIDFDGHNIYSVSYKQDKWTIRRKPTTAMIWTKLGFWHDIYAEPRNVRGIRWLDNDTLIAVAKPATTFVTSIFDDFCHMSFSLSYSRFKKLEYDLYRDVKKFMEAAHSCIKNPQVPRGEDDYCWVRLYRNRVRFDDAHGHYITVPFGGILQPSFAEYFWERLSRSLWMIDLSGALQADGFTTSKTKYDDELLECDKRIAAKKYNKESDTWGDMIKKMETKPDSDKLPCLKFKRKDEEDDWHSLGNYTDIGGIGGSCNENCDSSVCKVCDHNACITTGPVNDKYDYINADSLKCDINTSDHTITMPTLLNPGISSDSSMTFDLSAPNTWVMTVDKVPTTGDVEYSYATSTGGKIGSFTVTDNGMHVIYGDNYIKNKENKTMDFNFKFGPCNDNIRMSMYGLAVRNQENRYVSYDRANKKVVDVETFNCRGGKMFYMMPVAINDVKVGDVIIHNGKPCFVAQGMDSTTRSFKVINVYTGTIEDILPTTNMFNFNYLTKIVSILDMCGQATPSAQNPFGSMLPFMLMNDSELENRDVMAMMMLSQGNNANMNPWLMCMALGGKNNDNLTQMMLLSQLMNQNQLAPASAQPTETSCTCTCDSASCS